MLGIKQLSSVYWVNSSKTRVQALATYEDGTTETLSISTTEDSPFWKYVLENVPMETIDANTEAVLIEDRERRKLNSFRTQERDTQKKQNAIFNAKIEAFDMIEVANAQPSRKTKIRKAKSITEVMAHVAVCVIEYEQKQG
jgi:hypothetical protein